MKLCLLLLTGTLLFESAYSQSLPVQLHVRKHGKVKKRLEPGTEVLIIEKDGWIRKGPITFMKTDSLVINGEWLAIKDIKKFKISKNKKKKPVDWEQVAYVGLGMVVCASGMAISGWETWPAAIGISAVLGISPYIIQKIKRISFKKYGYRMGGRYSLRVWDLN